MKSKKSMVATAVVVLLFSVSTAFAATATKTAVNSEQGNGTWWLTDSNWNPSGKPTSSDTCLVPSKNYDCVNKFGAETEEAATFTGDSLQVGTVGGKLVVLVDQSSPNRNLKFPGKGLIFGRASYRAWNDPTNAKIDGDLTILSPESAPSDFSASKASTTYELLGKLIGEEGTCLDLNAETDTPTLTFPLTFDATEFFGKLRYNPKAKTMLSTFGNVTFNGTIEATRTKFTVPIGIAPTVAKLHISGTEVELSVGVENAITGDKRSGHLTVTKGITLAEGAKIRYTQTAYPYTWKTGADGLTCWPFLTVPVDSPLTIDSFGLTTRQTMVSGVFYPEYDLVVRINETAGTKTFVSRRRSYQQIEVSDPTLSSDGTRFAWVSCESDWDFFTKGSESRNLNTPKQESCTFGGKSFCNRIHFVRFLRSSTIFSDAALHDRVHGVHFGKHIFCKRDLAAGTDKVVLGIIDFEITVSEQIVVKKAHGKLAGDRKTRQRKCIDLIFGECAGGFFEESLGKRPENV